MPSHKLTICKIISPKHLILECRVFTINARIDLWGVNALYKLLTRMVIYTYNSNNRTFSINALLVKAQNPSPPVGQSTGRTSKTSFGKSLGSKNSTHWPNCLDHIESKNVIWVRLLVDLERTTRENRMCGKVQPCLRVKAFFTERPQKAFNNLHRDPIISISFLFTRLLKLMKPTYIVTPIVEFHNKLSRDNLSVCSTCFPLC